MAVARDEGAARRWFQCLAVIKETATDTCGQMTIVEITEPPGAEAPLHVHHREDEGFWVLEGDVTFDVGGVIIEAHAGDYAFGPRDIPHRHTVGPAGCRLPAAGCRMLFICTPGGFEGPVIAMSEPAASRTLPPPAEVEPDRERIAAIARSYGAERLGRRYTRSNRGQPATLCPPAAGLSSPTNRSHGHCQWRCSVIVARQVFQAKYGRGDELVEIMKEMNARLREGGADAPNFRILTDVSGPFFTVVTEVEVESLAAWETTFRQAMSQPWMGELFGRMVPLVESGNREFYTLVP